MRVDPLSRLILINNELVEANLFLSFNQIGRVNSFLNSLFDRQAPFGNLSSLVRFRFTVIGILVPIVLRPSLEGSVPRLLYNQLHQSILLIFADEILDQAEPFNLGERIGFGKCLHMWR